MLSFYFRTLRGSHERQDGMAEFVNEWSRSGKNVTTSSFSDGVYESEELGILEVG